MRATAIRTPRTGRAVSHDAPTPERCSFRRDQRSRKGARGRAGRGTIARARAHCGAAWPGPRTGRAPAGSERGPASQPSPRRRRPSASSSQPRSRTPGRSAAKAGARPRSAPRRVAGPADRRTLEDPDGRAPRAVRRRTRAPKIAERDQPRIADCAGHARSRPSWTAIVAAADRASRSMSTRPLASARPAPASTPPGPASPDGRRDRARSAPSHAWTGSSGRASESGSQDRAVRDSRRSYT